MKDFSNFVKPGYTLLYSVFWRAFRQAQEGKGWERHAEEGEEFTEQQICEIARRTGGPGSLVFQGVKKSYESLRLRGDRGIAELHGAMVYLAAAAILMGEEIPAKEEGPEDRLAGWGASVQEAEAVRPLVRDEGLNIDAARDRTAEVRVGFRSTERGCCGLGYEPSDQEDDGIAD